jgi:hypothetical protein
MLADLGFRVFKFFRLEFLEAGQCPRTLVLGNSENILEWEKQRLGSEIGSFTKFETRIGHACESSDQWIRANRAISASRND